MSAKKLIPRAQSGIQFPVILQPAVSDNTRYVLPYNSIEIAESKKAYEQEQLQKLIEASQKRLPLLKADTRSTTQRQRDHNRAIQLEVRQKANELAAIFGRALGANHDMTVDEVNQNTLNTANLVGYMTAPYLMTALESGYYGATRRPKEAAITAGVGFGLPIIFNGMLQLPNAARSYVVSRELKRGIKQATKLDETIGVPGQIGWAPKQTFTGYHASNEKTFNPNFWYENWARTTHNAPYGIYIAEGTAPTKGFLAKRPYVHNVTVELEKPMVQIGELLTNTKNSTRNGLERFAQKQGADAIIFQDIKDNQMNHQNILKTLNPDTQLIINNKASKFRSANGANYFLLGGNLKLISKALVGTQLQKADDIIYKALPLKAITITGEATARGKKILKYLPYLTDFQRAQLQKYYTNSDGTYTNRGVLYIEDMATANSTGQSQFMKDLNRVSHPVHEGLSEYRHFMNNHPRLELIYDVTSAGLSSFPLTAPFGYIMAGIDAASGVDDMVNNGVHFDNVVDVAGILPPTKYTKTIKGVLATRKGLRYRRGIPDIKINPIGTPTFGGEVINDILDAREIEK